MRPTALSLVITTPLDVVFRSDRVVSFRAADASGDFGIQPGHADFLTVLGACVARWRDGRGTVSYCALRGGVLTVSEGRDIRVACREGVLGDDLASLEAVIAQERSDTEEAAARARIGEARLHAKAIRQIMRRLSGQGDADMERLLDELAG
ncbi:F0F1 ATP synthase subunit epsilon [Zhengella mangrovi]|uniref:ATP synthase epsilon chain n=1 Tax=Zhengella mangrovi TaxID=1982044 RepID=A0A2G1QND1_9HYPH|nr:F0F1 ATP synthase subunit epsilon [Zhengella mangrovi]PHP66989.1 F0F1 ATP synthase subunit epsilon [Zhengella mangrovi]